MGPIREYVADIARVPALDEKEKLALIKKAQKGDREALDKVICAHLKFVISVAKLWKNVGSLLLEDLVQEGNFGLYRAIELYNPKKGSFTTYAYWWIRLKIQRAIIAFDHKECRKQPKFYSLETFKISRNDHDKKTEFILADEQGMPPEVLAMASEEREMMRKQLNDVLKNLPRKIREIVSLRLSGMATLETLAERYDCSRQNVSQIAVNGAKKIQKERGR